MFIFKEVEKIEGNKYKLTFQTGENTFIYVIYTDDEYRRMVNLLKQPIVKG